MWGPPLCLAADDVAPVVPHAFRDRAADGEMDQVERVFALRKHFGRPVVVRVTDDHQRLDCLAEDIRRLSERDVVVGRDGAFVRDEQPIVDDVGRRIAPRRELLDPVQDERDGAAIGIHEPRLEDTPMRAGR